MITRISKAGRIFLHLLLFTFLASAVISLSGCLSGCRREIPVQAYRVDEDLRVAQPSESIDIEFYIDASKSMRGFHGEALSDQENHFTDLLREADSILKAAWPSVSLHYWKFGGGAPQPIDSVIEFSRERSLFTENITRIDHAIQHDVAPDDVRNQIRIIVTDLFQDENDVGRLATELGTRYLHNNDLAVGILGVRNVFSGVVSDLPGSIPAGGADSLPFYMLLTGPVGDVRLAITTLASRMGVSQLGDDRCLHVVFSRRLLSHQMQRLKVSREPRAAAFVTSSSMVPGAKEQAIPQIGVYRRVTEINQSFYLDKQDVRHVRGRLLGLLPRLKPSVWIWVPGKNGGEGAWAETPETTAEAFVTRSAADNGDCKPSIPESPLNGSGTSDETSDPTIASCRLTIDARALPRNSIYVLRYDLAAEKGDVAGVSAWNLENKEARQVVQSRQFDQMKDGSRPGRTPNLRFFLQTISDTTFQSDVKLARYYLYVKVL